MKENTCLSGLLACLCCTGPKRKVVKARSLEVSTQHDSGVNGDQVGPKDERLVQWCYVDIEKDANNVMEKYVEDTAMRLSGYYCERGMYKDKKYFVRNEGGKEELHLYWSSSDGGWYIGLTLGGPVHAWVMLDLDNPPEHGWQMHGEVPESKKEIPLKIEMKSVSTHEVPACKRCFRSLGQCCAVACCARGRSQAATEQAFKNGQHHQQLHVLVDEDHKENWVKGQARTLTGDYQEEGIYEGRRYFVRKESEKPAVFMFWGSYPDFGGGWHIGSMLGRSILAWVMLDQDMPPEKGWVMQGQTPGSNVKIPIKIKGESAEVGKPGDIEPLKSGELEAKSSPREEQDVQPSIETKENKSKGKHNLRCHVDVDADHAENWVKDLARQLTGDYDEEGTCAGRKLFLQSESGDAPFCIFWDPHIVLGGGGGWCIGPTPASTIVAWTIGELKMPPQRGWLTKGKVPGEQVKLPLTVYVESRLRICGCMCAPFLLCASRKEKPVKSRGIRKAVTFRDLEEEPEQEEAQDKSAQDTEKAKERKNKNSKSVLLYHVRVDKDHEETWSKVYANQLAGDYREEGTYEGKKCFVRKEDSGKAPLCMFWGSYAGLGGSWYIAPRNGGSSLAWTLVDGERPPLSGWLMRGHKPGAHVKIPLKIEMDSVDLKEPRFCERFPVASCLFCSHKHKVVKSKKIEVAESAELEADGQDKKAAPATLTEICEQFTLPPCCYWSHKPDKHRVVKSRNCEVMIQLVKSVVVTLCGSAAFRSCAAAFTSCAAAMCAAATNVCQRLALPPCLFCIHGHKVMKSRSIEIAKSADLEADSKELVSGAEDMKSEELQVHDQLVVPLAYLAAPSAVKAEEDIKSDESQVRNQFEDAPALLAAHSPVEATAPEVSCCTSLLCPGFHCLSGYPRARRHWLHVHVDDDHKETWIKEQARDLTGDYYQEGIYEGRKCFVRTDSKTPPLYMHWDNLNGGGWYIGPMLGSSSLASAMVDQDTPPLKGWIMKGQSGLFSVKIPLKIKEESAVVPYTPRVRTRRFSPHKPQPATEKKAHNGGCMTPIAKALMDCLHPSTVRTTRSVKLPTEIKEDESMDPSRARGTRIMKLPSVIKGERLSLDPSRLRSTKTVKFPSEIWKDESMDGSKLPSESNDESKDGVKLPSVSKEPVKRNSCWHGALECLLCRSRKLHVSVVKDASVEKRVMDEARKLTGDYYEAGTYEGKKRFVKDNGKEPIYITWHSNVDPALGAASSAWAITDKDTPPEDGWLINGDSKESPLRIKMEPVCICSPHRRIRSAGECFAGACTPTTHGKAKVRHAAAAADKKLANARMCWRDLLGCLCCRARGRSQVARGQPRRKNDGYYDRLYIYVDDDHKDTWVKEQASQLSGDYHDAGIYQDRKYFVRKDGGKSPLYAFWDSSNSNGCGWHIGPSLGSPGLAWAMVNQDMPPQKGWLMRGQIEGAQVKTPLRIMEESSFMYEMHVCAAPYRICGGRKHEVVKSRGIEIKKTGELDDLSQFKDPAPTHKYTRHSGCVGDVAHELACREPFTWALADWLHISSAQSEPQTSRSLKTGKAQPQSTHVASHNKAHGSGGCMSRIAQELACHEPFIKSLGSWLDFFSMQASSICCTQTRRNLKLRKVQPRSAAIADDDACNVKTVGSESKVKEKACGEKVLACLTCRLCRGHTGYVKSREVKAKKANITSVSNRDERRDQKLKEKTCGEQVLACLTCRLCRGYICYVYIEEEDKMDKWTKARARQFTGKYRQEGIHEGKRYFVRNEKKMKNFYIYWSDEESAWCLGPALGDSGYAWAEIDQDWPPLSGWVFRGETLLINAETPLRIEIEAGCFCSSGGQSKTPARKVRKKSQCACLHSIAVSFDHCWSAVAHRRVSNTRKDGICAKIAYELAWREPFCKALADWLHISSTQTQKSVHKASKNGKHGVCKRISHELACHVPFKKALLDWLHIARMRSKRLKKQVSWSDGPFPDPEIMNRTGMSDGRKQGVCKRIAHELACGQPFFKALVYWLHAPCMRKRSLTQPSEHPHAHSKHGVCKRIAEELACHVSLTKAMSDWLCIASMRSRRFRKKMKAANVTSRELKVKPKWHEIDGESKPHGKKTEIAGRKHVQWCYVYEGEDHRIEQNVKDEARQLNGNYREEGIYEGKKYFVRKKESGKERLCIFWSTIFGFDGGWYIGPTLGGTSRAWVMVDQDTPPPKGWLMRGDIPGIHIDCPIRLKMESIMLHEVNVCKKILCAPCRGISSLLQCLTGACVATVRGSTNNVVQLHGHPRCTGCMAGMLNEMSCSVPISHAFEYAIDAMYRAFFVDGFCYTASYERAFEGAGNEGLELRYGGYRSPLSQELACHEPFVKALADLLHISSAQTSHSWRWAKRHPVVEEMACHIPFHDALEYFINSLCGDGEEETMKSRGLEIESETQEEETEQQADPAAAERRMFDIQAALEALKLRNARLDEELAQRKQALAQQKLNASEVEPIPVVVRELELHPVPKLEVEYVSEAPVYQIVKEVEPPQVEGDFAFVKYRFVSDSMDSESISLEEGARVQVLYTEGAWAAIKTASGQTSNVPIVCLDMGGQSFLAPAEFSPQDQSSGAPGSKLRSVLKMPQSAPLTPIKTSQIPVESKAMPLFTSARVISTSQLPYSPPATGVITYHSPVSNPSHSRASSPSVVTHHNVSRMSTGGSNRGRVSPRDVWTN